MKKVLVLAIAMLFISTVSAMGGADVNVGTYNSNDHFTTKFWKEKFLGGGHGEPGNVLMGLGQGFTFQNVVLTGEPSAIGPIANPCDDDDNTSYGYTTIYSGGYLKLNSKGPWLDSGKLKIPIEEATNISGKTNYGNGYRLFTLTFSGKDETGEYYVDVTVTWCETENNYDEKKKFHRGYDFYAEIEISEADETVECPCWPAGLQVFEEAYAQRQVECEDNGWTWDPFCSDCVDNVSVGAACLEDDSYRSEITAVVDPEGTFCGGGTWPTDELWDPDETSELTASEVAACVSDIRALHNTSLEYCPYISTCPPK